MPRVWIREPGPLSFVMGRACRAPVSGKDAIRHEQGITDVTTSRPARPRRRRGMATFLRFTIGLQTLAAVLAWRPGGGSPGPIVSATVFLGLVLAQVVLGIAHVAVVHVPLGVLLFGFSLLPLRRRSARLPPT